MLTKYNKIFTVYLNFKLTKDVLFFYYLLLWVMRNNSDSAPNFNTLRITTSFCVCLFLPTKLRDFPGELLQLIFSEPHRLFLLPTD